MNQRSAKQNSSHLPELISYFYQTMKLLPCLARASMVSNRIIIEGNPHFELAMEPSYVRFEVQATHNNDHPNQ